MEAKLSALDRERVKIEALQKAYEIALTDVEGSKLVAPGHALSHMSIH